MKDKTRMIPEPEEETKAPVLEDETEDRTMEQTRPEVEEEDEYAGYTRENPPPWLDEFEYIDFMMTH